MTLAQVYMAGGVQRYHANPGMARLGQTNADHQGRCVQLLLALHPAPSVALIWAVAHHDVGERWAGDLPALFKKAQPEIAAAHAEAEMDFAAQAMGWRVLDDLSREDVRWLALIDGLEAWAFMRGHAPGQAERDGWPDARKACLERAWSFGPVVGETVLVFLNDLDRGAW
jgi:5'-deoxynucleotidase